ncbi:MAG: DUF503 domain-containing protein [Calditrichae bacterium]|nr:DUF503 domain-containing protein [Calditrichota bacterium]MCB9057380.1 DUF503 domain-containing protein [Calditrichia bacterium]
MIVGLLEIEILIPGSESLKDKRIVIKSIKDLISKKFNASVAEIDFLDKWQRSLIAFAVVSNSKSFTEDVLQKIFHQLDKDQRFEICRQRFEYK